MKKFILYRILGNDLPPRHALGQTYQNAKFILDNEPDFEGCEKRWVVNRIADPEQDQKIRRLLEEYGQHYLYIPFNPKEYAACKKNKRYDYLALRESESIVPLTKRKMNIAERIKVLIKIWTKRIRLDIERHNKILYVMNNNGARNAALRDGRKIADWILPFDGNSCFTKQGWQGLIERLSVQRSTDTCFVVPMYRLKNNSQYFTFNPMGCIEHEPQIVFGRDCKIEFNEYYGYGHRSKIELLLKLGFKYEDTIYGLIIVDPTRRCGYVLRLFSGVCEGEADGKSRRILREESIDLLLQKLDKKLSF